MKPKRLLNEAELLDFALKTLGGRAVSAGELRDKLRLRAERKGDVDVILAKVREYGYLNDKQFAETYAARRKENEGFGRARVMRDLRARRVSSAVAEKAVDAAFAGADEVAMIEQFLARKYRRTPVGEVVADPKGLASVYRKLRLAGFSSGPALQVLKRHSRDAQALDSLESAEEPEDNNQAGEG